MDICTAAYRRSAYSEKKFREQEERNEVNVKLNLDFSLYKGTTQLKQWWKAVKEHFTQVQEAHNALEDIVSAHKTASVLDHPDKSVTTAKIADKAVGTTQMADYSVGSTQLAQYAVSSAKIYPAAVQTSHIKDKNVTKSKLSDEVAAVLDEVPDIRTDLDDEVSTRQNADTTLQRNIDSEASARKSADSALDGRVKTVEEKAHAHANKTVLDGISSSDVAAWNGIKEQVSKTQLDSAIAAEAKNRTDADSALQDNIDAEAETRADADSAIIALVEQYKSYLEDICFGFLDEFQRVYGAIGITVYDGGIFGMEQSEIALDGGNFSDEVTGTVDCGEFEPLTAAITAIDGGEY